MFPLAEAGTLWLVSFGSWTFLIFTSQSCPTEHACVWPLELLQKQPETAWERLVNGSLESNDSNNIQLLLGDDICPAAPWTPPPFLHKAWFSLFSLTTQEAEKICAGLDLFTGYNAILTSDTDGVRISLRYTDDRPEVTFTYTIPHRCAVRFQLEVSRLTWWLPFREKLPGDFHISEDGWGLLVRWAPELALLFTSRVDRDFVPETPKVLDSLFVNRALLEDIFSPPLTPQPWWEPTQHRTSTTSHFIRKASLAEQLKALYADVCQLCGYVIEAPSGARHSEAHHLLPLGNGGPDITANMMVLCPTHHKEMDVCTLGIAPDTGLIIASSPTHPLHRQRVATKHALDPTCLRMAWERFQQAQPPEE